MGHFGISKSYDILYEDFFWAKIKRDFERYCSQYIAGKKAKSKAIPQGLYAPSPTPCEPWVDFSWTLLLGYQGQKRERMLSL